MRAAESSVSFVRIRLAVLGVTFRYIASSFRVRRKRLCWLARVKSFWQLAGVTPINFERESASAIGAVEIETLFPETRGPIRSPGFVTI